MLVGGRSAVTQQVTGAALTDSNATSAASGSTLISNATTTGRSRELVSGADAKFSVDRVGFTRSSNSVTDLIANTTLSLTAADPNVTATVSVNHSATAAQAAVQAYVRLGRSDDRAGRCPRAGTREGDAGNGRF